jgi:hypothetical protein
MADIWSRQKRSEVMSLIRSRENKATELRLIEIFREFHITGWRRNQPLLASRTSPLDANALLFLWTVAFGTVARSATNDRAAIRSFGMPRSPRTGNVTDK